MRVFAGFASCGIRCGLEKRVWPAAVFSLLILFSALMTGLSHAETRKVSFNIPPQELSSALKTLATQTNIQLLYDSEIIKGLRVNGLKGDYTPEEALRFLLKDTAISIQSTGKDTFTLTRAPSTSNAAPAVERVKEIPTLIVTATKTERMEEEIPASVTVITSEDIEQMQATKTEEVLKHVEGVDLRSNGGVFPGGVSLRGISPGFSGETTLVLINGMSVEPVTRNNRYAWELVSPGDIDRIEIVRGPASALYGPNAVGGVINIITKKGEGEPSVEVAGGYGSHNSYSIGASAAGSIEKFGFRVGASQYKTDGYKRVSEVTPFGWNLDLEGRDYTDKKINAQVGYGFSDEHEISVSFNRFDADGAWYGGRPNYRTQRYGDTVGLDYKNKISETVNLRARLNKSDLSTRYTEDNYDSSDPTTTLDLASRGSMDEYTLNGEAQADLYLFEGNTLTVGASLSPGEYKSRNEDASGAQTGGGSVKSETTGVYLQDEHKFGDSVIVNIGGRWDRFRLFDDKRYSSTTGAEESFSDSSDEIFNPRGGIRFNPAKGTSIYASAGTAYVPALNSLKYSASKNFVSNPNLKPEKSTTYEVGMSQSFGGFLKGKASLFQTAYKDKIRSVSVGESAWPKQYQNIGETVVNGGELALDAVIDDYWYPFINYTYTEAKVTKNPSDTSIEGKRAFLVPYSKFNVGITYDNPRIVTVRIAGRYVGDRYWDDKNSDDKKLDSFFVTDVKVSRRISIGEFGKDLNISLSANNLFDADYSEYGYYEKEDRRNFWLEASLGF